MVLGEPIKSIAVISKKDYDAQHLADSDVSGYVEACFVSHYEFVKSRYVPRSEDDKKKFQTTNPYIKGCSYKEGARVLFIPLNEICEEKTHLLGTIFVLNFKTPPSAKGEYEFAMNIEFSESCLTTDFVYVFE